MNAIRVLVKIASELSISEPILTNSAQCALVEFKSDDAIQLAENFALEEFRAEHWPVYLLSISILTKYLYTDSYI